MIKVRIDGTTTVVEALNVSRAYGQFFSICIQRMHVTHYEGREDGETSQFPLRFGLKINICFCD